MNIGRNRKYWTLARGSMTKGIGSLRRRLRRSVSSLSPVYYPILINWSLAVAEVTASVEQVPNWDNDRSQSEAVAMPCGHPLRAVFLKLQCVSRQLAVED